MTDITRTAILSMICLPLTACVLDAEEPEAIASEDLGTMQSALCSDGPPDAVVAFTEQGGLSVATSALPTYDFNHPGCEGWFVVEVNGLAEATRPFLVAAGFADDLSGLNPLECLYSRAKVRTYEYGLIGSQCSGGGLCAPIFGWRQVGDEIQMGGTMKGPPGDEYCELDPLSPLPSFEPSVFRNKLRVAVRTSTAVSGGGGSRAYAGVDSRWTFTPIPLPR